MKILLTTVCNDDYALGGQVMLYSMKKNLNDFDKCDIKIYYNDIIHNNMIYHIYLLENISYMILYNI